MGGHGGLFLLYFMPLYYLFMLVCMYGCAYVYACVNVCAVYVCMCVNAFNVYFETDKYIHILIYIYRFSSFGRFFIARNLQNSVLLKTDGYVSRKLWCVI